jgi:orotidine 5'-phosphate decarboxylase subfamily 2
MKPFFTRLETLAKEKNSLLCVGLDPRIDWKEGESPYQKLVDWNERIIESTTEYAICYKPNIAFFEAYGPEGLRALEKIMEAVPEEIPVLIDAKRNDIGSTAQAYADSLFGYYDADCVTLSPYMGRDAVDPFLKWKEKAMFLLARTTKEDRGFDNDKTYSLSNATDYTPDDNLHRRVYTTTVAVPNQRNRVINGI